MKNTQVMGKRVVAFLIDFMFVILMFIVFLGIGIINVEKYASTETNTILSDMYFVSIVYFGFFALAFKGRTIGKMIFKLQVFRSNGWEVKRLRLFFREVLKSVLLPAGFISLIVALFSDEHYSFHDLLADTLVSKK